MGKTRDDSARMYLHLTTCVSYCVVFDLLFLFRLKHVSRPPVLTPLFPNPYSDFSSVAIFGWVNPSTIVCCLFQTGSIPKL